MEQPTSEFDRKAAAIVFARENETYIKGRGESLRYLLGSFALAFNAMS
jgi:hypothetical protein